AHHYSITLPTGRSHRANFPSTRAILASALVTTAMEGPAEAPWVGAVVDSQLFSVSPFRHRSVPLPPSRESVSAPPSRKSLPSRAEMESLPAKPYRELDPAEPVMVSLWLEPRTFSTVLRVSVDPVPSDAVPVDRLTVADPGAVK